MFKIQNNIIYITRGDTGIFDISILDSNKQEYILKENDTLTFTVKEDTVTVDILIQKTGKKITIEPNDTANLLYGDYIYDVQLIHDGIVDTIITPNKFSVCQEVTF